MSTATLNRDLKTFFNSELSSFLKKFDNVDVKKEGDLITIKGEKFPSRELAEKTDLGVFADFYEEIVKSYVFKVNIKEHSLTLTFEFKDIGIKDIFHVTKISVSELKITYDSGIHISKVSSSADVTLFKKHISKISLDLDGDRKEGEICIKFDFDNKPLKLDINAGVINPEITLVPASIELKKEEGGEWEFETEEWELKIGNFPSHIFKFFNSNLKASFKGSSEKVTADIKELKGKKLPYSSSITSPKIPLIDIDKGVNYTSLGDFTLAINKLELSLTKEFDISIESDIDLILPQKINGIFGLKDSKPIFDIFKHKAGNSEEEKIKLSLEMDKEELKLTLLNSPFENIHFEDEDGKKVLDLKDAGKYKFSCPEFIFKTESMSWSIEGDFEVVNEPKSIPLKPLKEFLKRNKLDIISKLVPSSLPVNSPLETPVTVFLEKMLKKTGIDKFGILDKLSSLSSDIKDEIAELLGSKVPKSFKYSLNYSEGSFKFDVEFMDKSEDSDENQGIKAVFPSMTVPSTLGPVPGLCALNLKKFSFGEIFGVSVLNITAHIDFYDLTGLIYKGHVNKSTLDIDNMMIINPYTFPVPLFFDNAELDINGIGGLKSSFKFPQPVKSYTDLIPVMKKLITALVGNKEITEDMLDGVNLSLTIGDNYLKLPEFTGGSEVGHKGNTVIDEKETVINLLNWLKNADLNSLIKTIPREYREIEGKMNFDNIASAKIKAGLNGSEELNKKYQDLKNYPEMNNKKAVYMDGSGVFSILSILNAETDIFFYSSLLENSGYLFESKGTSLGGLIKADMSTGLKLQFSQPYYTLTGNCDLFIDNSLVCSSDYAIEDGKFRVEAEAGDFFVKLIENKVSGEIKSIIQIDNYYSAKVDVINKQKAVDKAQADVDEKQKKVDEAQADLDKKRRKLKNRSSNRMSPCFVNIDINPFHALKKAFEAAKGVLNAAKSALDAATDVLNDAVDALSSAKGKLKDIEKAIGKVVSELLKEFFDKLFKLSLSDMWIRVTVDKNKNTTVELKLTVHTIATDLSIPYFKIDIENPIPSIVREIKKLAGKLLEIPGLI